MLSPAYHTIDLFTLVARSHAARSDGNNTHVQINTCSGGPFEAVLSGSSAHTGRLGADELSSKGWVTR